MRRFKVLGQVLILLASLLSASKSHADHELLWKLRPGQELIFSRSYTQTARENNGPESRNIYVETIRWRVGLVESDGSAKVTQTLDRVHGQRPIFNRGQAAKAQMIDFDSDEVYPEDSQQAQFLDIPKKQIEFGEFSFTLTPQGEALNLVDSEKLKKFRHVDEKNARRFFSEDSLRTSIPSVPLPKGEFKIGTSWAEKPKSQDFRLLAQPLSINYRATGMTERDGHQIDEIEFEIETDKIPTSQSPFRVAIKEFRCGGKILFDAASGRMLERRRETVYDTVVSQSGRNLERSMRRIEVTTFVPRAEKPAR